MSDTEDSTFHIYYRAKALISTTPCDHFIKDGEALCDYGVSVPDEDSLKPFDEVSATEWAVLFGPGSRVCGQCARKIEYYDVIPDDLPDDPPVFICPICDEPADLVNFRFDTVHIDHQRNTGSKHPTYETHTLPREMYDAWRQNPEGGFTYPKLREYINENPDLFDIGQDPPVEETDWTMCR
jgi:hypothetical protein